MAKYTKQQKQEYVMAMKFSSPEYIAHRKAINDNFIDHDFDYYFTGSGLIQTRKEMAKARNVYESIKTNW